MGPSAGHYSFGHPAGTVGYCAPEVALPVIVETMVSKTTAKHVHKILFAIRYPISSINFRSKLFLGLGLGIPIIWCSFTNGDPFF